MYDDYLANIIKNLDNFPYDGNVYRKIDAVRLICHTHPEELPRPSITNSYDDMATKYALSLNPFINDDLIFLLSNDNDCKNNLIKNPACNANHINHIINLFKSERFTWVSGPFLNDVFNNKLIKLNVKNEIALYEMLFEVSVRF